MKTIIYDFNGTILNDVNVCLKCLNMIVKKHLDRDEVSLDEYLHVFTFPVIDYYQKVGFDFDRLDFKEIGQEWMDLYDYHKNEYYLYPNILKQLQENKANGIRNILLSASRIDKLLIQCEELNIKEYFDEILGIDNIYATSKINIAKEWFNKQESGEYLLIGDTLHDLEVARSMGIDCALVAKGHQAKDVLLKAYDKVYNDISEVKDAYWSK